MACNSEPSNAEIKSRGRYKRWLLDPQLPIPSSTLHNWKKTKFPPTVHQNINKYTNEEGDCNDNDVCVMLRQDISECTNTNHIDDNVEQGDDYGNTYDYYTDDEMVEVINGDEDDIIPDEDDDNDDDGAGENSVMLRQDISECTNTNHIDDNVEQGDDYDNTYDYYTDDEIMVEVINGDEDDIIPDEDDDNDDDGGENSNMRLENDNTDEENNDRKIPLYPGCPLTAQESEALLLAFAIRHHLTDVAIDDMTSVLNCILPVPAFGSKYVIINKLHSPSAGILKKYYCDHCNVLLTDGIETNTKMCEMCRTLFQKSDLDSKNKFFIYIPLRRQLEEFVNGPLFKKLQRPSNTSEDYALSDVIQGSYYRSLIDKSLVGKHDLTIQMNTDGVSVFNSSKFELWPIQILINELPVPSRRANIMLCALWFNEKKPNMDLFLQPFIHELKSLETEGVLRKGSGNQGDIVVKVHLILAAVDAVARAPLQNIHQFNGSFGCTFCLQQGTTVQTGDGHTRVYPGSITERKRTLKQHLRDCELAVLNDEVINGVKGPSLLLSLRSFHIADSFSTEYMHNVLLGVEKMFTELWLDSSNHLQPWYIGTSTAKIDENLLKICPPIEVTRTPRSITYRAKWKAHEWRNFLLYYSFPCLSNILPSDYLNHWCKLIFAIYIFLKPKHSSLEWRKAKEALEKFVSDVDRLYGIQYYKFNVHILLHIPECVLRFGALWAHSAFPFEHYNGVLGKMFNNSQAVSSQICKHYLRYKAVEKCSIPFVSNLTFPAETKKLFLNFLPTLRTYITDHMSSTYKPFNGASKTYKEINISLPTRVSIQNLVGFEIKESGQLHSSCYIDGVTCHSLEYNKMVKRNNSIVQLTNGTFVKVLKILTVFSSINSTQHLVMEIESLPRTNRSLPCDLNNIYVLIRESKNISVIFPHCVEKKCIGIATDDNINYVIPLVNNYERD